MTLPTRTDNNLIILHQMQYDTEQLGMLAGQVSDNRMPGILDLINSLGKQIRLAAHELESRHG